MTNEVFVLACPKCSCEPTLRISTDNRLFWFHCCNCRNDSSVEYSVEDAADDWNKKAAASDDSWCAF